MKIVDDETNITFFPEWWMRYVRDSRNYRREILEAREKNFKRLGIEP